MKGRSASKIKLTSYDELLGGGEETNDIQQVSLEHLHSFENHPFQVNDDEAMAELVESVKEEGILTALLVRPLGDGAYIFFSVEEIMEMLNCGRNKAVNCLKELDQEKGIGLIEKRRIGLGKTNVIYVKNFSLTEYPDEPAIFDSEETPENVAERKENTETEIEEYAKKEPEKPVNTQKFEKQTSGSLKNKLQEVSKTNFKEFEKQTSRSLENKLQEVSKTNCNNT